MSMGFSKVIREISLLYFGVGVACYCDTIPAPIRRAWCTIPAAGPGILFPLATAPGGGLAERARPGRCASAEKKIKKPLGGPEESLKWIIMVI